MWINHFHLRIERGVGLREQIRRFGGMGRDKKGIAAVEFALILPFMMLLYLGTAELTYGLMANRKMTLAARTLSDLVAQQNDTTSATPGRITDAKLTTIFTAANAIMAPFTATPLKLAVSSIGFTPNTATPPVYTARTQWTAISNTGTPRPCSVNLTSVANTSHPSSTTMPAGLFGAGTVIVADVSYDFTPPFSGTLFSWTQSGWGQAAKSSITFTQNTYMKPRSVDTVTYNPTTAVAGRTKCP